MSGFSFRRRDPDAPEEDAGAPAVEQEGELAADSGTSAVDHIAEYSSRGSDGASAAAGPTPEPPPTSAGPTPEPPPASEAGVGTRIDAIVAAAELVGEQIRRDAEAEAGRIREEAASARADAARTIAQADEHARGVREAAGTFAATRQREAEEEAGTIIARAEARARSLESETARRSHSLTQQTKKWEENLHQLVTMCRDLADDLEALGSAVHEAVPGGAASADADPAAADGEHERSNVHTRALPRPAAGHEATKA